MTKRPLDSRRVLASILGLSALYGSQASAQTLEIPTPPSRSMVDSRNVDLMSAETTLTLPVMTIGGQGNGMAHTLYWMGLNGFRHEHMISIAADDYYQAGYHVTISFGKESSGFTWNGAGYVSDKGDGSTLVMPDVTKWNYTDRDGTIIEFNRALGTYYTSYYNTTNYYGYADGVATLITRPDGQKTRLTYKSGSYYYNANGVSGNIYPVRLQSATNSSGYQFKFGYRSNALSQATANDWSQFAQTSSINNAVDYCDPTADSCTGLTRSWPTIGFGLTTSGTDAILSITDPVGRTTGYVIDNLGRLTGIRRPSASGNSVTYGYYPNSKAVSSVDVSGAGAWNYTFLLDPYTAILTGSVTTPTISTPMNFTANYNSRQPLAITDEIGRTTSFTYDGYGRVQTVTPHGSGSNYSTFGYDARGNLVSQVVTPKSGSGLTALSTSATYAASCTNAATCNKPITTTNSAGKVTNYFYNANGTLDYDQAPAPSISAPRPETHYSYVTAESSVKNASGTTVPQGDIVTMSAGATTCLTGAWPCATSDQAVTQVTYTGASAKNLLPTSTMAGSGTGTPSSTTSFIYDDLGNRASVTDPLGNTSTVTYAADRQPLSAIGPSIDGSPTSRRRAAVFHYNTDGQVDSVSSGSINPDGSSFITRQAQLTDYDAAARKTKVRISDGTSDVAVTQFSYDGAGRPECTAQRMNPGSFGSLPSACTLSGSGAFGPDRIARNVYDSAGQLTQKQLAYGVSGTQINEASFTYTTHGQVETATDAKGNVTAYAYDGFDRLLRTCYNATVNACQNGTASDYEEIAYDTAGRQTQRSLRGQPSSRVVVDFDDLNRIKHVTYPGSGTFDQPIDYQYNNLGSLLSVTDGAGHAATYSYDALGRVTSQGDEISSRTMQYDAAGRRTRSTWPDGFYVTYDYNGASDLSAIRENGSTALASFTYDDVGRRTGLIRGNGVATTYTGYTPLGLGSLAHDLAGTSSDVTLGFSYNPAGQIVGRSQSNDAYSWTGGYNVNRSYVANTLNQYTLSGSVTPSYDMRGNLTSAGAPSYAFSTKNELVQRSDTGTQFYYGPGGRFDTITVPGVGTTRFQYDGAQISTELDGAGAVQRRYVFGPGDDEALVWYEGASTGTANRRYLVADERGSVIAVTDDAGQAIALNTYDAHGIPGSTNLGRFQYTGQAWIPELGMYSFKARIYSPTLGRFLQTDPIGYGDGMNWYAYAGNDPVNRRDPSGLFDDEIVVTGSRGGGISFDYGSLYSGYNAAAEMAALAAQAQAAFNQSLSIAAAQVAGGRQTQKDEDDKNDEDEIVVTAKNSCGFLCKIGQLFGFGGNDDGEGYGGYGGGDFGGGGASGAWDGGGASGSWGPCCFVAGTLVSTPTGFKAIETLKIGDMVMSRSDKTGETAAKPIVGITPAHERQIWTVTVSYKGDDGHRTEERYETTDDHPWRTTDGRWVTSASLRQGQALAREDGTGIVTAVADAGVTKLTYNLEIAEFHTYFVGQGQMWVHNACSPNQMNRAWRAGQAPRGIGRTDIGKVKGEKQHTIIEGVGAINKDGTWKHGGGDLSRAQADWLRANGYDIR